MSTKWLLTLLITITLVFILSDFSGVFAFEEEVMGSAPIGESSGSDRSAIRAEEENQITAAAPVLTYWRVAGSVLRPRYSATVDTVSAGGGGCIYAAESSTSAFTIWNTPIHLPQGAQISLVRMYYDDTSPSNSTAWFTIYDLYGDIVQEWGVSSSGDSGNGFEDTDTIDHTVNYQSNSYVLNWRPNELGSDMQLCGFRIFYYPPPSQRSAVVIPLFD